MRGAVALGLIMLPASCALAQSSPMGLWRLTDFRMDDVPKEFRARDKPAQTAFLRMMPDGRLLYVYSTQDGTWDIRPGAPLTPKGGWNVWRGTWSMCGKNICMDRVLIYSDAANAAGQSKPFVCTVRADRITADWRGDKMTVLPNVQNGMRSHEESLRRNKDSEDFDKVFGKYLLADSKPTQIDDRCGPAGAPASSTATAVPPGLTTAPAGVTTTPASTPEAHGSRVEEWLRTHPK